MIPIKHCHESGGAPPDKPNNLNRYLHNVPTVQVSCIVLVPVVWRTSEYDRYYPVNGTNLIIPIDG